MKNFVLFLVSAATILIGCEKKVEEKPVKLEKFYFAQFKPTGIDFTLPGVTKHRVLYLKSKPLEQGNNFKFAFPGVFPVMAYTSNTDSMLVKIFVTNNVSKLASLKDGNTYALLMRHSDATKGTDDFNSKIVEWWKSCEVAKARQIDENGIDFAKSIGENLKLLNIPIGKIYTSEFCRCRQTVENFNLGSFIISKELTYVVYKTDYIKDVKSLMSKLPIDNKVHLLNGHSQLIGFRSNTGTFNWNDAYIYKLSKDKEPEFIDQIFFNEWQDVKFNL